MFGGYISDTAPLKLPTAWLTGDKILATYPLSLSADITRKRDKAEAAKASSTLVDLFNKRSRTVPEEVIDLSLIHI